MDQDICKVGSWSATVSHLSEISEPKDWVTPPGCLGCIGIELPRPPSERNYITTCHKMMPVSECCGLIARLGDAIGCRQPALVFHIFEADAGQVRSLTSPRFQSSGSRNWLEQIVHAAALETPESQIGIYEHRAKSHERFYMIEVHRHRFARRARKVPFQKCEHWRKVCGRSAKDQIASTLYNKLVITWYEFSMLENATPMGPRKQAKDLRKGSSWELLFSTAVIYRSQEQSV